MEVFTEYDMGDAFVQVLTVGCTLEELAKGINGVCVRERGSNHFCFYKNASCIMVGDSAMIHTSDNKDITVVGVEHIAGTIFVADFGIDLVRGKEVERIYSPKHNCCFSIYTNNSHKAQIVFCKDYGTHTTNYKITSGDGWLCKTEAVCTYHKLSGGDYDDGY